MISGLPPAGSKISPAIWTVMCLLPELIVSLSPTLRPVSVRKAVFTSTWCAPWYQCPEMSA